MAECDRKRGDVLDRVRAILRESGVRARVIPTPDPSDPPHVSDFVAHSLRPEQTAPDEVDHFYRRAAVKMLVAAKVSSRTPGWVQRRLDARAEQYVETCARVLRKQDEKRGYR